MKTLLILNILLFNFIFSNGQEVQLEKVRRVKISKIEVRLLEDKWKEMFSALSRKEADEVKKLSLKRLYCSFCDSTNEMFDKNVVVPVDTFIRLANCNLYGSKVWSSITTADKYMLGCIKLMERVPEKHSFKKRKKLLIYFVSFSLYLPEPDNDRLRKYHEFQFVKDKGVFIFYGLKSS